MLRRSGRLGGVADSGQVGTGIQDSVGLFALVLGQAVGVAHDPGHDGAGLEIGCGGSGRRCGAKCRDVPDDGDPTVAVAAFANLTEEGGAEAPLHQVADVRGSKALVGLAWTREKAGDRTAERSRSGPPPAQTRWAAWSLASDRAHSS